MERTELACDELGKH